MSQGYAIKSKAEAIAYLAHPMLGTRLAGCTSVIPAVAGSLAHEISGSPDAAKFGPSMTLFDAIDAGGLYHEGLDRFFDGKRDPATLLVLERRLAVR